MLDTPDAERIARQLVELGIVADDGHSGRGDAAVAVAYVVEQLRLMWNARGAADLANLQAVLSMTVAAPYLETMDHVLRRLDR